MKYSEITDHLVYARTGRSWEQWYELLDGMGAQGLPQREITEKLIADHALSKWWARSITKAFEYRIGRRLMRQVNSGTFQTSTSKTLPCDMDITLHFWKEHLGIAGSFNGISFISEPSVQQTGKWRYWKVELADGSKVSVVIGEKPKGKSHLAVNHEKLEDAQAMGTWKSFWRNYLWDFCKALEEL